MPIEQLNVEVAAKRLEVIVRAAESVCTNQGEMVALFITAIATLSAASPCCGDQMMAIAVDTLTKARGTLAEAKAAMAAARIASSAGPS